MHFVCLLFMLHSALLIRGYQWHCTSHCFGVSSLNHTQLWLRLRLSQADDIGQYSWGFVIVCVPKKGYANGHSLCDDINGASGSLWLPLGKRHHNKRASRFRRNKDQTGIVWIFYNVLKVRCNEKSHSKGSVICHTHVVCTQWQNSRA